MVLVGPVQIWELKTPGLAQWRGHGVPRLRFQVLGSWLPDCVACGWVHIYMPSADGGKLTKLKSDTFRASSVS